VNTTNNQSDQAWLKKLSQDDRLGAFVFIGFGFLALLLVNFGYSNLYEGFLNFKLPLNFIEQDITLSNFIADGLLTLFFLMAGLELKHAFTLGSLSKLSAAVVPIFAATFGMLFSGSIYFLLNFSDSENAKGWPIPISTDVALAIAVLSIALPKASMSLRAFLLAVAVVNDVGAISIISIVFSKNIDFNYLIVTLILFAIYFLVQKLNSINFWILLPLGIFIWYFAYKSGIHPTIAGVVLGLLTDNKGKGIQNTAHSLENKIRPITVLIVLPLFSFSSLGIDLSKFDLTLLLNNNLSVGVITGLVIGQPLGIIVGSFIAIKIFKGKLPNGLSWNNIVSIGFLAGIGFTVALLISELTFNGLSLELAKVSVVLASLISALIASIILRVSHNSHLTSTI
jgi:NhaA family Na+:H+ antiporter